MLANIAADRRSREWMVDGRQRPWGPATRNFTGYQYDDDV